MAIHEGRWDCTYCGNTGILGRYTTCTGCGRSRPEGVKFYLPDEESVVIEQKLLKLADAEADWICQYCDSSNRAEQTSCQHCSAPREAETPTQAVKNYDTDQAPREGDNAAPARPPAAAPQKRRWPALVVGGLAAVVALIMLMCGLVLYAGFKTYEVELTVTGVSWERAVPIEAYRTVVEGDWAVPEGGRPVSAEQRIHHYEQVLDHYETKTREVCEEKQTGTETYTCGKRDRGNGFFEDKQCTRPVYKKSCRDETYRDPVYRDEPVYQTWHSYEIEKWVLDRTATASGDSQEVYWPEYTLADHERAGERSESYSVFFVDPEGQTYSQSFTYDEWLAYQPAEKHAAVVDFFGELTEIKPEG